MFEQLMNMLGVPSQYEMHKQIKICRKGLTDSKINQARWNELHTKYKIKSKPQKFYRAVMIINQYCLTEDEETLEQAYNHACDLMDDMESILEQKEKRNLILIK
jgi:hypothetical protein